MSSRTCLSVRLLLAIIANVGLLSAQDANSPAAPADASSDPAAGTPMIEPLLKLKEMPLPNAEQLLTQKPRDWIVLNNDDVLVVDPLVPRPRTLEIRKQEISQKTDERNKVLGEKRELLDREIAELNTFVVSLPQENEVLEYRLPLRQVKQFVHHEDLMLRRIESLLMESRSDLAYELLSRLERDRPDWPGLSDVAFRILLLSARQRLQAQQPEAALALLEDLRGRNPRDVDTRNLIGEAIKSIVEPAIAQERFILAQHYLNYLQQRLPDHPVYVEFSGVLKKLAVDRMGLATAAFERREFRTATIEAERAVRIWPPAGELRVPFTRYATRYQRLHVGVTELPGERLAYPVEDAAERRRDLLTKLPLFEAARLRDGTAYYRTRFFDEWEPQDLGRKMRFRLRPSRQPFSLQNTMTAADVAAPLLQRLDPSHPDFDERLAAYIESIEVVSPAELTMTFSRVPPRVEPLLGELSLIIPSEEEVAAGLLTPPGGFVLSEQTPDTCVYTRSLPEPDQQKRFHVSEIVEHRYESPERLVQGLRNGEVSMVTGLPDVDLRGIVNDENFNRLYFLQPCLFPETHLLQFNPASEPLRISELRRGLAYAVDGDRILKQIVLMDDRAQHGRLVTTPFYSRNPGAHPGLKPRRYDLSNAFALTVAARHQLKGTIRPLTMVVAPGRVAEAAAEEIAKSWRKLGLEIQVVKSNDPAPPQWDILYRTLQMSEPVLEMWPFLTFSDRARIEDLKAYPDWIKQEIVQLDRTGDQGRAVEALQTLHQHLWNDTAYIPLWEVDQFVILRKNIQGFPQRFTNCYDTIDEWVVSPWYQETLP